MHIYISGGCKNGKSHWAQRLAKALGAPLYYIATMIPMDEEDERRIERHIADRAGWGFETIECGRDILRVLDVASPDGTFLLDSVTALLANEMFPPDGQTDRAAPARVADQLERLLGCVRHAVLVSDYIYGDAAIWDGDTGAYIAGLAYIDRHIAAVSDAVLEICAGQCICHKGANKLAESGLPLYSF